MAAFVFFKKLCKIKVYYILHLIKWKNINFQFYCCETRKQLTDQNSDWAEADNWVQLGPFKGKGQISETVHFMAFYQLKQTYLILKRKHRPL